MNSSRSLLVLLLSAGLLGAPLVAAYQAGGAAFTKLTETKLLAEPKMLAAPTATLPLGRKVAIKEVKGGWLRVADGGKSGWVFGGNLSETKPEETAGLDGLGLSASDTSATAAARPLSQEASAYAERRNLGNARADLDWLLNESRLISAADVEGYLRTHQKGEYQ